MGPNCDSHSGMGVGWRALAGLCILTLGSATAWSQVTFTPSVAPLPDLVLGDLTPLGTVTPEIVTEQGPLTVEQVNDVFAIEDAFDLFDLVGDTPNTPTIPGFTSDEAMVYTFLASPVFPIPGTTNDAHIAINGVRIPVDAPIQIPIDEQTSGLDLMDVSFSVPAGGGDGDPITVIDPSFEYHFDSRCFSANADGALIDVNLITMTAQNLQGNSGSSDFMVWTVDQGPDAISGGLALSVPLSEDLSQWTFVPAITQVGSLGNSFPGDYQVAGSTALSEDFCDDSIEDLVVSLGDTHGDSYTFWASPRGMIPYVDDGVCRLTWRVQSNTPTGMTPPTFRLRHVYGAYGILGSGIQLVSPVIAPAGDGRTYEYIFDFLDAATATGANQGVPLNSVTLYFDVVDFMWGVGGEIELEYLEVRFLDRSELMAQATVEREVTDQWNTSIIGTTGNYNTTDAPDVVVDTSSPEFALITTPGPLGRTITPGPYGLTPFTLAFDGVGLFPFAPSATSGQFYRAEFDLDFSGATDEHPLATTSLTMASFLLYGSGGLSQALGNETTIHSQNPLTGQLNPTLSAPWYSVYLALPEGGALDGGPLGSLIGANVRQIDSTDAGGTLTINSIRIDSFPEGLLP